MLTPADIAVGEASIVLVVYVVGSFSPPPSCVWNQTLALRPTPLTVYPRVLVNCFLSPLATLA